VEIPIGLDEAGNECIFIDPVKYKNWQTSAFRLQTSSSHPKEKIKVVERFSKIPLSLFLVIYENWDNVRMVRKYKPDVVVSWDSLMSFFLCIYCWWKKIPFVFDAMDDWEEIGQKYFIRFYFRYIVKPVLSRLSYAITATSHRQTEDYSKYNKRVYLVPNGKSMEFIKNAGQISDNAKAESKTVNFIATLRDWYDFDLMFEVFKEFPELKLNIYGQGESLEYLKTKSAQYSNVTMMGNADSSLLPQLNAETLFGIIPLKMNKLNDSTCPIKLFDYWSAKKAVIVNPTYELKKVGANGGLIFALTKEEYVNAIKSLLANPDLRKSTGEKGYDNMLTKYNYDKITNLFVDSLGLDKQKLKTGTKYLFLSDVVWNYYRVMNIELPLAIAALGNECIYIDPIRYKQWEKGSVRLQNYSSHSSKTIKVIERFSKLPKSLFILLYENYNNVRMIKKHKPDVVVSFDHLMSLSACLYCKRKHIPFVFNVVDDWEEVEEPGPMRFYYKHIVKPILNRFSSVITSTSHTQTEIFSKRNKNVHLVPNGKPTDFIRKAVEFETKAKAESRTVNFVASLRDWYDFDLLFDVFKQFPELQLNIYGQGELFEYLKNKSMLYSNVALKGNADSEILPQLISESLFGILPLKLNRLNDTTCPVKLFDYWSAKKAVIASPTYELKKISEDGGIILAGTKEQYISGIKLLIEDAVIRESLAEQGYQNMITKYNYDIIVKQFIDSIASKK
jgi:glycosyltransferase involved in cell wall biosynthesis